MEEHKNEMWNIDYPSKENSVVKREWKDITTEFFDAVKELKLGELLHDNMFGLFEAMSAIEMMDPKMDAGMCCNKDASPLTFDSAIDSGKLKLSNLEYKELIGIMDGVFSCMVSWLEGHSLAQTLLTCLYLHQPQRIEDKNMKAFVCAIYKLIHLIRFFVLSARVFEEEDFQPSNYSFEMFADTSETKAMGALKQAEEELQKKSKENEAESKEIAAVITRLKFTRLLLHCLTTLYPSKNTSTTLPISITDSNARSSPNKAEMVDIVKILNGALELTQTIEKTIDLGTQPAENADEPNPMGFSPMVNQRLLPPTFPRYTKIKDRSSSINYLGELIQRLKHACKIVHCTTYHTALNFFMDFSKKFGPCLLSRSILQILYLPYQHHVFGTSELTEVLKQSAKAFIAPPALMPDNPLYQLQQAKECVDSFFLYNEHTFAVFFEVCGFNRARQRDKLACIFQNFANLQDEAERVDAYLHSLSIKYGFSQTSHHLACFGTWVLYYCLRAMSLFLLSGLELELYSIHEYLYVFWYLYQFLFGWIVSALNRADSFLIEQEYIYEQKNAIQGNAQGGGAGKNQKKSKPNKKRKPKTDGKELIYNQALQNMCGGYFKAMGAFIKDERIKQPLKIFDNEQVRFEHRFAPFGNLTTPPPMPYSDFKNTKSYLLKTESVDLYALAAQHFHAARALLESVPNPDEEWADILKVAKTNFVIMRLLASGHNKGSKTPPEFDFSAHRYFPIIKTAKN